MGRQPVVKKTVRPFPFPVSLKFETGEGFSAHVLKVAVTGMIVELGAGVPAKPGQRLEFSFEIPVLRAQVSGQATVVKLYNQLSRRLDASNLRDAVTVNSAEAARSVESSPVNSGSSLRQLAEIRFKTLSAEQLRHIQNFLKALGQSP